MDSGSDDGIKICGKVQGCYVQSSPSRVETAIIGHLHVTNKPKELIPVYFHTIWKLMLAGFCLLFLIGCSDSTKLTEWQLSLRNTSSEILSKQTETLDTLQENTAALRAIEDKLKAALPVPTIPKESQEVIPSALGLPDDPQSETHPSQAQIVVSPGVRLYVSSAEWCGPCKRLWADVEAGKLEGFDVQKADDFPGLRAYPAIRYEDTSTVTGWAVRYGYDDSQLQWLKENLLKESNAPPANPQANSVIYQQPVIRFTNRETRRHRGLFGLLFR